VAIADMFLKLDGVTGEAHDADHKDEIEVMSWAWGMAASTDVGTGQISGKAKIKSLSVNKRADRSTPTLIGMLKTNAILKKGSLTVRKAGGPDPLTYYEILLEKVRVVSFDTSTQNTELMETVTLAFEKATFKYTPQGAKGGAGTGTNEYTVDAYTQK
jgi:type VI secretion system secreted protein Hcp